MAFQDALRLEILALAQWNQSAITRLFQSPWNQITGVSNDSANPGGVTAFRCAKHVVDLSKAPRDFTASIISSPTALTTLRIKHHAQGQEAVVLPGFTERMVFEEYHSVIVRMLGSWRRFGSEPLKDYSLLEVVHMSLRLQFEEGDSSGWDKLIEEGLDVDYPYNS
ncbi:hypothetical protein ARMGADRAFT_1032443 [Armillaria gallica]|uniref:Uncharacterized protein n=1 Tax=Armillaria gallica TaxID=47427 RepID=A0A2H3DHR8_ARMGA|nr:hypothetical protein ARMGADRAFT_1032443 [Armillaria gallica]